jgi:chromosome segregation ATPase
MVKESKTEIYKRIQSEYHQKLKEIESNLASLHKELHQVENGIKHERKKTYGSSDLATLKAKKGELNVSILKLKKDIKKLNKEKNKKIKKLKKS